jgi:hypothetical protein
LRDHPDRPPYPVGLGEELMGVMGDLGWPKVADYTDEQLALLVDFQRFGRELQENHAEWLEEKLAERERSGS